jgi:SlyX protein
MKDEDRLADLESRLEFQDATIAALNDEIVGHAQRVSALEKSLERVVRHLRDSGEQGGAEPAEPVDEPPPHY